MAEIKMFPKNQKAPKNDGQTRIWIQKEHNRISRNIIVNEDLDDLFVQYDNREFKIPLSYLTDMIVDDPSFISYCYNNMSNNEKLVYHIKEYQHKTCSEEICEDGLSFIIDSKMDIFNIANIIEITLEEYEKLELIDAIMTLINVLYYNNIITTEKKDKMETMFDCFYDIPCTKIDAFQGMAYLIWSDFSHDMYCLIHSLTGV